MTTRLGAVSAAVLFALVARTAAAVTMQLSSATVSNPGDSARLCVALSSGGQLVAGTQNDLIWDGNCASLSDEHACSVAGSHGKQLSAATKCGDFCLRAIIISLGDVDPIPDGLLYCCNFQSEADAGGCCQINMTNTGASDPQGHALGAQGGGGRLCTSGSSNQPARGFDQMGGNQLPGANNALPGGGEVAPQAPAPAPQGRALPPAQVLQGGGVRVGNTPEAALPAPTMPAVQLPTVAAVVPPAAAPGVAALTPRASAPPIAPPTSAATQVATAPPRDTPTARRTVAPTHAPTKAAPPPKAQDVQPQAKADEGGGWFGCQISAGASLVPVIGLGLVAFVAVIARRRSRSQTQR